ncbi:MarR family winged helix-turn-helix transcriptional regulator [Dinghuibacter silviterrae]|uniref:Winged helix DNA-binding protein n=1 Tax=Dinghuibacter silviterrae TaxID=1539049 RepID=A0A4R8DRQ1_9BACT|nr:MarR family winged helix-turn-helix transcriptional regulator [Dinghuibacter silviterrae]TDX00894.1 winged helix DNA-binding protein [Dinghuibacter silviterrae]
MNAIDQAGVLAISTRLQRLSDQIRKDGLSVYQAYGIDFQPKWFPVIYTLHVKKVLGVVEMAAEIGYSHPSTISLLKELEKERLIRSSRDKTDERRRLLRLTEKGEALVIRMLPVWDVMAAAIGQVTGHLMKAIRETEEMMKEKSILALCMKPYSDT